MVSQTTKRDHFFILISHLLTFGGWLNLLSLIQIMIQVILMRGKCNYIEIGIQTLLAFVYGYLTNFSCYLIRGLSADAYLVKFAYMAAGCFILALGIWIQLKGAVAMLPGEAMNRAISMVTGFKYENIKIFFDVLYIAISALICMCLPTESRTGSLRHLTQGIGHGSVLTHSG